MKDPLALLSSVIGYWCIASHRSSLYYRLCTMVLFVFYATVDRWCTINVFFFSSYTVGRHPNVLQWMYEYVHLCDCYIPSYVSVFMCCLTDQSNHEATQDWIHITLVRGNNAWKLYHCVLVLFNVASQNTESLLTVSVVSTCTKTGKRNIPIDLLPAS